jgi:DNA-nicking Smr family endonuclease
MADDDGPLGTKLGELLRPHLDTLTVPPVEPPRTPEPPLRRLDEGELMALIYAHLDDENPRVCEGIEFERLEVLAEREVAHAAERSAEVETETESIASEPAPPMPRAPAIDVPAMTWIGRSWTDDIAAVPSEWLDRPQPRPEQLALLRAVESRRLAQLNLRRLARELALRHLELFVRACQANRVSHCRVIPGKGVNSRAEPVLKRALLEWCRGPGRAWVLEWAPELDQHGEWGSAVLRLSLQPNPGTNTP